MSLLRHILDVARGKHPMRARRSPRWPAVRAQHLARYPRCEVCGGTAKVEVHHKVPFHLDPGRELDPKNLVTLCEAKRYGLNCHLLIGHRGDYRKANASVVTDAAIMRFKLEARRRRMWGCGCKASKEGLRRWRAVR